MLNVCLSGIGLKRLHMAYSLYKSKEPLLHFLIDFQYKFPKTSSFNLAATSSVYLSHKMALSPWHRPIIGSQQYTNDTRAPDKVRIFIS